MAISGESGEPEEGRNKPKPLPAIATGCVPRYMARRGSPVRVRKRALQKPRMAWLFALDRFAGLQRGAGIEPPMEPSGPERPFLVAGFNFDCASSARSRSFALRRVRVAPERVALGVWPLLVLFLVLRVALLAMSRPWVGCPGTTGYPSVVVLGQLAAGGHADQAPTTRVMCATTARQRRLRNCHTWV